MKIFHHHFFFLNKNNKIKLTLAQFMKIINKQLHK